MRGSPKLKDKVGAQGSRGTGRYLVTSGNPYKDLSYSLLCEGRRGKKIRKAQ